MTREQASEILEYIAQEIISPLSEDDRPAKDAWLDLTSEPFNKLCKLVNSFVCDGCIRDQLKVKSFESCCSTSSGQPVAGTERKHNLLFNNSVISEDKVNHLIETDMYEYDVRVINCSDEQLKCLRGKKDEKEII